MPICGRAALEVPVGEARPPEYGTTAAPGNAPWPRKRQSCELVCLDHPLPPVPNALGPPPCQHTGIARGERNAADMASPQQTSYVGGHGR